MNSEGDAYPARVDWKQVQEELRDQKNLYEAILKAQSDVGQCFFIIEDGRIIHTNAACDHMTGYCVTDLLNFSSFYDLVIAEQRDLIRERFQQRLRGEISESRYEIDIWRKDGREVNLEVAIHPLRLGDRTQLIVIGTDISERKRITEELKRAKETAEAANRAKSEFLANMSHEIRTPMNTIVGMAHLLSESALTPTQQEYVRLFRKAGETLLHLIDDIIDLSKVETGNLVLEAESFDLNDIVERTVELFAFEAHKKGLELTCDIKPDVPTHLTGDSHRLSQVLVNLLGNAMKFTAQGEIVLRVQRDPYNPEKGRLLFSVADTGIGITPERQETIFEMFTQEDATITRKYGGAGLGLAISKKLVELMHGRIWVESERGAGSTFSFIIQFELPDDLAQDAHRSPVDLRGLKVLVIDDNATNRLILREVLSQWGVVVVECESGLQGLAEIKRAYENGQGYHLLLLDSRMPDMDGFQVAERLGPHVGEYHIVILLLTSENRTQDIDRAHRLGISRYLVKPVRKALLWQELTNALRRAPATSEASQILKTSEREPFQSALQILLVEDSEDNQAVIQLYLARTPHEVDIAKDGQEAVQLFQTGQYDLVFMDMQMPLIDGYTATRKIRRWEKEQHRPPTPIVALSAHALKDEERRSLEAGCTAHLSKPIRKEVLLEAIATYVQKLGTTSHNTPDKIEVLVSADLEKLMPTYLMRRQQDVEKLQGALLQSDYETIRILGHSMKGSGSGYDLDAISDIGNVLEQAAQCRDAEEIRRQIEELTTFLQRVKVVYRSLTGE